MRLWGVENDLGDLWKLFMTSLLQNDHLWDNRNCVTFGENNVVGCGECLWGPIEEVCDPTFAKLPILRQLWLCQIMRI